MMMITGSQKNFIFFVLLFLLEALFLETQLRQLSLFFGFFKALVTQELQELCRGNTTWVSLIAWNERTEELKER